MRAVAGLGSPIELSSGGLGSRQSLPEASDVAAAALSRCDRIAEPTFRIHFPPAERVNKLSVPKRRSEDRREAVADRNRLRRRRDGAATGPRRDRCVRMIASERRRDKSYKIAG